MLHTALAHDWSALRCPCGHPHIWDTAVYKRAGKLHSGCPICSGKRPCKCSSLAARHPHLAAQWDQQGNGDLKPEDVREFSNRMVKWTCQKHSKPHTWAAVIASRTHQTHGNGCPECARRNRTDTRLAGVTPLSNSPGSCHASAACLTSRAIGWTLSWRSPVCFVRTRSA